MSEPIAQDDMTAPEPGFCQRCGWLDGRHDPVCPEFVAAPARDAQWREELLQQAYRIANALERMAIAAESQGVPDLAAMSASIFGGLGDALAAAQTQEVEP